MRETLYEVNLLHELRDLLLLQSFQANTLHSDHLTCVKVQRAIHSTKLPATNAVAELLETKCQQ